ncbi:Meiosis-specific with OB domain-containing protein [Taenia crassiceps]|uniref:Meiosis-specific with OB domain-containing protein n=1 Tax=Taenia crassiceps TaxID=6207 RepID=A0ABR4QM58_9CEST
MLHYHEYTLLGDVVLVLQGQAKIISEGSYEDICIIRTTSKFSVVLSEGRSRVLPYSCNNKVQINKLRTELLCPAESHLTLKQVVQCTFANKAQVGDTQSQQSTSFITPAQLPKQFRHLFTFFAAVTDVGEIKSVVLNRPIQKFVPSELSSTSQSFSADHWKSYQRVLRKCEVTLIDESCGHFPMILWNEDLIMFALRFWKPRVTVLSIVDCPVRYDAFRRGVVAVPNDRTAIITMPSCEEAARLSQYAKYSGWCPITGATHTDTLSQHIAQPPRLTFSRVPPEVEHVSLTGIHTVRTIEDIINGNVSSGFGIVFAMPTKLSLDIDDVIRLVRLSCSNCQRRMQVCEGENSGGEDTSYVSPSSALFTCLTLDCPLSGQRFQLSDSNHVLVEYNVFLNLTDHTGTYTRCTFTNSAMENTFGMQANDFLQLSPTDRGQLKWKLLLNRYKIYFWMRQPGYDQPTPYLNVLACERPNPFEVYSSLPTANCQ